MSGSKCNDQCCPACDSQQVRRDNIGEHLIWNCCRCGHGFADLQQKADYEQAYTSQGVYSDTYVCRKARLVEQRQANPYWFQRVLFRRHDVDDRSVLDVGCGIGEFLVQLQSAGATAFGLDVSEEALKVAREVHPSNRLFTDIRLLPEYQLFDIITLWEVVEHVANPVDLLRGLAGRLKLGGLLAVSTPNWRDPFVRRTRRASYWPPYHVHFFTPASLRWMVDKAGLSVCYLRRSPMARSLIEATGGRRMVQLALAFTSGVVLRRGGSRIYAEARPHQ